MRFALTPERKLDMIPVISMVLLLIILVHDGEAQKSWNMKKKKQNDVAVCNEDCRITTCDAGQTCSNISRPTRGYYCYECRDCIKTKKYVEKLMPNQVLKVNEECLHIRIQCAACPDCSQAWAHTSSGVESPENSEFFRNNGLPTVWSALGLSVVVNLLLLSILVNCGRRKPQKAKKDNEGYEAMTVGIEMQQQHKE